MTLSGLEKAARRAGMDVRLHPEGGLEIVAPGANLHADHSGEIRVVQGHQRDGERALQDLLHVATGNPKPRRSELASVRKLAIKALVEARRRANG